MRGLSKILKTTCVNFTDILHNLILTQIFNNSLADNKVKNMYEYFL